MKTAARTRLPRRSAPEKKGCGGLGCRLLGIPNRLIVYSLATFFSTAASPLFAADYPLPEVSFKFPQNTTPGQVASTVEIIFILTLIGLAPSILALMTSFTRIFIVFGFLRRALGLQTMPPDQILVGISLFLTMFIMAPTFERIYYEAFVPYKKNEGTVEDFKTRALAPVRDFMFGQTRKSDLKTMIDLADIKYPKDTGRISREAIPTHVLVPAFVISEMTRAFKIGFLIYLPFFLVDLVIAAVLMSMGMMMIPPVLISLPFKVLLFVLVDGWNLLIVNLVQSFYT